MASANRIEPALIGLLLARAAASGCGSGKLQAIGEPDTETETETETDTVGFDTVSDTDTLTGTDTETETETVDDSDSNADPCAALPTCDFAIDCQGAEVICVALAACLGGTVCDTQDHACLLECGPGASCSVAEMDPSSIICL